MKKLIAMVMLMIMPALPGLAMDSSGPSPARATEIILALEEDYPDGSPWDKEAFYTWNGGIYEGGNGGLAFLFMVSDAVFGKLPARITESVNYDLLRPGDILRVNDNTHSVLLIDKLEDHVTVVEVSVDRRGVSRVYWGRTLSKSAVEAGDCVLTRYPDGSALSSVIPGDVNADGLVDGRDLLRLAQYVAGQDVKVNVRAADMNGDGNVDGRDLMRLDRYVAGLDEE